MSKKKDKKKKAKKVRITPKTVVDICDESYADLSIIVPPSKFNKHLFKNRKKIIKLLKEYIEVADKYSSISPKFRIFTSPALDMLTFFKKVDKPNKFSETAFLILYISFISQYVYECEERDSCKKMPDTPMAGAWCVYKHKTRQDLIVKVRKIFSKIVELTYFDVYGISACIESGWFNNYNSQLAGLYDNRHIKFIINAIPDMRVATSFHNECHSIAETNLLHGIINLSKTLKMIQPSLVDNFEGDSDAIMDIAATIDDIIRISTSIPSNYISDMAYFSNTHSELSKRTHRLRMAIDYIINFDHDDTDDSIIDTSEDSEECINSSEDNGEWGRANTEKSDNAEDGIIIPDNLLDYLGMPHEETMKAMDETEKHDKEPMINGDIVDNKEENENE